MAEIDWQDIGRRFREPMATHSYKGKGGMAMTYITARQAADRLDEVVGPGAWSTAFQVLQLNPPAVECTLTIHGVSKADVGYNNDPGSEREDEPLKAAYSDALKRAAVQWGIGRFLYGDTASAPAPRPVAPVTRAAQPMPQAAAVPLKEAESAQCEECGADLTETRFKDGTTWSVSQLAGYARRKFGRVLCMAHYKATAEARRATVLSELSA